MPETFDLDIDEDECAMCSALLPVDTLMAGGTKCPEGCCDAD